MNLLKSLFYLPRNDRIGIAVIVVLVCVSLMVVTILGNDSAVTDKDCDMKENPAAVVHKEKTAVYHVAGREYELFPFDPNTADSSQLLRLGLAPWQVRSIYRYRAAGGAYMCKEDFARLYGLTKKQYERLAPYIRIGSDFRQASEFYGRPHDVSTGYGRQGFASANSSVRSENVLRRSRKLHKGEFVNIDVADTSMLKRIPGIGTSYANAIVNYRERLGGFADVRQVLEVGGVPEMSLAYMRLSGSNKVKVLNLNKMSFNQLRRHPYLNFYQTRDICEYRRLHGPLKDLSPLRATGNFTEEDIARLAPYVTF